MAKAKKIEKLGCSKELREFHKKARELVGQLSQKRDELRSLIDDYADILESADDAQQQFEDALDKLSELL